MCIRDSSIWVFIKLPQEFWIHVAQLDFTEVVAANPAVAVILGVVVAMIVVFVGRRRPDLPPPDWPPSLAVDAHPTTSLTETSEPPSGAWALLNHPLVEKTMLASLVTTVFLQLLPDPEIGVIRATFVVGAVVLASSSVGYWICSRRVSWSATTSDLIATAAVNLGAVAVLGLLPPEYFSGGLDLQFLVLLLILLILIVVLYDRYRGFRLVGVDVVTRARVDIR